MPINVLPESSQCRDENASDVSNLAQLVKIGNICILYTECPVRIYL